MTTYTGTAFADYMYDFGTSNDTFQGQAGNDQIESRGGSDYLNAGDGDDYAIAYANYYYNGTSGHYGDTLSGGAGNDTLLGAWTDSNSIIGGTGNDQIGLQDYPGGNSDPAEAYSSTLDGGAGNDTIVGGGNSDVIYGGDNADDITDWYGNNTIDGGTGADEIQSGEGADSILGGDGADWIGGYYGNDTIDAGIGNDYVEGGIVGGMVSGDGNDLIYGGDGFDTIVGGNGADTLWGSASGAAQDSGADRIYLDDYAYAWSDGDDDADVIRIHNGNLSGTAATDRVSGFETGVDTVQISVDTNVTNVSFRLNTINFDWDGDGTAETTQRLQMLADLNGVSTGWNTLLIFDPLDSGPINLTDVVLI